MMLRTAMLLLLLGLCSGCAVWSGPASAPQGAFVEHVVLVWLKEPGNAAHRQRIIQASKSLREIPGVQNLQVGEVVMSDRPVVEDSFDVALSLRFASLEDLNAYLVHPLHKQAVKTEFLPVIERYQVMDFAGTH